MHAVILLSRENNGHAIHMSTGCVQPDFNERFFCGHSEAVYGCFIHFFKNTAAAATTNNEKLVSSVHVTSYNMCTLKSRKGLVGSNVTTLSAMVPQGCFISR